MQMTEILTSSEWMKTTLLLLEKARSEGNLNAAQALNRQLGQATSIPRIAVHHDQAGDGATHDADAGARMVAIPRVDLILRGATSLVRLPRPTRALVLGARGDHAQTRAAIAERGIVSARHIVPAQWRLVSSRAGLRFASRNLG